MKTSEAIKEFSEWRRFKVQKGTVVRYARALRTFCLAISDPDVEDININRVMEYLTTMERLGWERNGIVIVCLALRKFFEYLNLKGEKVISEQLIPLPRKEYKIPRIADVPTFRKLINVIPVDNNPHNLRSFAFINLLWDTGARTGELCSINVSDLDLVNRTAIIKTEKTRGMRPIREIFWSNSTNGHLKRWLKKREHLMNLFDFEDEHALFVSISICSQHSVRGKRMSPKSMNEVMRVLSNRAKIATVNPHSFRHYNGRKIIEMGGTSADVSNILGHSDIRSSYIYTMMHGKQLKKRWNKFKH